MARTAKTVRTRIFSGYIVTVALIIALVVISSICLLMIGHDYKIVTENRDNQATTQQAISAHYDWLDKLSTSIQTGAEFTGSLDSTKCSLGLWMAEIPQSALNDAKIKAAVDSLKLPHDSIHSLASTVLQLSQTDSDTAYAQYVADIKPQVSQVISDLNIITSRYGELSDAASVQLNRFIELSLITSMFFALAAAFFALTYANSISKKISLPIAAVAEWSQHLSVGKDSIDFDKVKIDESAGSEMVVMVDAFRKMAESIQENVSVVRRVAEGDMTAFVNIRSRGDSLGQNLYKMVQSNDLLFAEILQIAHTVANGSDQIARASQALAESTNTQASSVSGLSSTIDYASNLIENNTERTKEAATISGRIHIDAKESSQKLSDLLRAMEEIREASSKVSTVIRTIDDIAFQTNILALNAAVEAARAGEAGKGFAVVANEVRQLALKSAEAVTASRELIDDTVNKTHEGNRVSSEAAEMFQKILGEIEEIVQKIQDIASASDEQIEGIGKIRIEIAQISQAASSNAAISQESAASSEEMLGNADLLRQQMSRFNLRKRQMGQAYIPPEKRNDPDFIRIANEHYQRSVETGKIGFELEDPFTEVSRRKDGARKKPGKAAAAAPAITTVKK